MKASSIPRPRPRPPPAASFSSTVYEAQDVKITDRREKKKGEGKSKRGSTALDEQDRRAMCAAGSNVHSIVSFPLEQQSVCSTQTHLHRHPSPPPWHKKTVLGKLYPKFTLNPVSRLTVAASIHISKQSQKKTGKSSKKKNIHQRRP